MYVKNRKHSNVKIQEFSLNNDFTQLYKINILCMCIACVIEFTIKPYHQSSNSIWNNKNVTISKNGHIRMNGNQSYYETLN